MRKDCNKCSLSFRKKKKKKKKNLKRHTLSLDTIKQAPFLCSVFVTYMRSFKAEERAEFREAVAE